MTVQRRGRGADPRSGRGPRWAPIDVPIDSPARWSLRVARIGGVEVRLHALLAAWVGLVGVRILAGPLIGDPGPRSAALIGLEAAAVLLAAGLHEIGRLAVARRFDALPLSINLWPLGSLDDLPPHAEWRARVRSVAGGLGALLVVGTIVGGVLLAATGTVWGVVIPSPMGTLPAGTLVLGDGTQPNWLIVLHEFQRGLLAVMALNLVPVAPLSGGRFLEAILMRARGRAAARRIAVQVWLVTACILLLAALALGAWLGVLAAVVGGVGAATVLVREQSGGTDAVADPPADGLHDRRGWGRHAGRRGVAGADEDLPLAPRADEDPVDHPLEQVFRDADALRDLMIGGPDDGEEADEAEDARVRPRGIGGHAADDLDADTDTDGLRDDAAAGGDAGPDGAADGVRSDEADLDRVLAKIASGGMACLDARDRAILEHETARRNGAG